MTHMRITDRIKSITCSIRRNFANRSPEILVKIYNTYVQTRLDIAFRSGILEKNLS
jgi:hypothetical protein